MLAVQAHRLEFYPQKLLLGRVETEASVPGGLLALV